MPRPDSPRPAAAAHRPASARSPAGRSFDWSQLRAFLAAVEAGSFSGAARALGSAQPTVGRQVAALEADLGVSLFERGARGLVATPAALDLLEHVRAMDQAAARIARVAAGQALSLEGPVRITASEMVAVHLLTPLVAPLHRRYPGLRLEIIASNAPQDLARREADVALRSFRPREPELIARKLRDGAAHLYATQGYLRSLGKPVSAAALERAQYIGFGAGDAYRIGLERILGLRLSPEQFPFASESQAVQWALARQGLGIAIMMAEVGDAEPGMRRVSASLPPVPVPLWLVTHRDVHTSRRVRVVADALAEGLSVPRTSGGPRGQRGTRRHSRLGP